MKRKSENILVEWLVLGAQSGDQEALVQLIKLLYPKLLRYAFRQLNDRDSARDVVQNAFEVLSKDLRKVNDPAAFIAWIYQITHRKGVDHIRGKQRQRALHDHYQYEQDVHASEQVNSDAFDVSDVLAKLDSEQYQLVHLYYLEGFSIKEIAKILGVPSGTIKSRLFKARQQLKTMTQGGRYEEY